MADLKDQITNTTDTTEEFEQEDIEKNKVLSIFAYLSWLLLIPLFAAKDSKFARYHVNQGLILAIIEIVSWVVFGILTIIPYVGFIFWILGILVSLCCVALAVLGIINVANGKAKELPFIGKIRILK